MARARRRRRGAALALGLLVIAPAAARTPFEPTVELPAGGLVFNLQQHELVLERKDVVLGIDKVRITYVVRNPHAEDRALPTAFPMPEIDMASLEGAIAAIPAYDPANPTNFVGFWTMIDGVAVEPDVDVRAKSIGHIDVTESLRAAKIPLFPFAPELDEALLATPRDVREDLVRRGVLKAVNGDLEPAWKLETVFHWSTTFPAGRAATIQHGYRPVVGVTQWTEARAEKFAKDYCVSSDDVRALTQKASEGKPPAVYLLHYHPPHNSWLEGRAAAYSLTLEKPEAGSIVASCRTGLRASGLELRADEVDFENDAWINVLIVE
jgi:hypothetical protein